MPFPPITLSVTANTCVAAKRRLTAASILKTAALKRDMG
jgi:hypothetical protein